MSIAAVEFEPETYDSRLFAVGHHPKFPGSDWSHELVLYRVEGIQVTGKHRLKQGL